MVRSASCRHYLTRWAAGEPARITSRLIRRATFRCAGNSSNNFIVQIAAGRLEPGEALPSVRQMERLKKIHRHTVSRAYGELVAQGWLTRTRGSVLRVNAFEKPPNSVHDLNSVVDLSIRLAQEHGYTAEQLHQCLRARLERNRPDHLLIVSTDAGLSTIIETELRENVTSRIRQCSPEDLSEQSRRSSRAMIVWIAGSCSYTRPSFL